MSHCFQRDCSKWSSLPGSVLFYWHVQTTPTWSNPLCLALLFVSCFVSRLLQHIRSMHYFLTQIEVLTLCYIYVYKIVHHCIKKYHISFILVDWLIVFLFVLHTIHIVWIFSYFHNTVISPVQPSYISWTVWFCSNYFVND